MANRKPRKTDEQESVAPTGNINLKLLDEDSISEKKDHV
jgi:hypothetical protein